MIGRAKGEYLLESCGRNKRSKEKNFQVSVTKAATTGIWYELNVRHSHYEASCLPPYRPAMLPLEATMKNINNMLPLIQLEKLPDEYLP